MAKATKINKAELTRLLTSPTGPLGRELMRRAALVEAEAKRLLTVQKAVDTGRLRSSITIEPPKLVNGTLVVRIGTNVHYACILGAHTHVTVEGGSKTIGQIVEGDRVLTQTGEYREVLKMTHFPVTEKPDLVEIVVPWRVGRDHRLTVTADHKILVDRDGRYHWVEAGDLRMTDELQMRRKVAPNVGTGPVKTCERCDRRHDRQGRHFCSIECRDAHWAEHGHPATGGRRSDEWKAEASERHRARLLAHPEQHPNKSINRPTDIERSVGMWLVMRGVSAEFHPYIGGLWPDFYSADEHRIYEADGAYWHKDQAADIERDRQLLDAMPGVQIVHLHFFDERHSPALDHNPLPGVWYVPVNPSPDSYVEPEVFVGRRPTSIRSFRYERPNPRAKVPHLYDLAVEGVHSFMANGLLVSNSYVEHGTGIYGPRKRPIVPVKAKVLRFVPKGQTKAVFAASVKGMKARPYLVPALAAANGSSKV